MASDHTPTNTQQTDRSRKQYLPPKLVHYGNLREITRALGGINGMNDGGAGKDKTG
ncbi:MAG TPA: hypothetical protein VJP89_18140 [Pyrinomonadaceae bacterium]|nr:hypothetical protein [Pyrinomonadaceae bacterium]